MLFVFPKSRCCGTKPKSSSGVALPFPDPLFGSSFDPLVPHSLICWQSPGVRGPPGEGSCDVRSTLGRQGFLGFGWASIFYSFPYPEGILATEHFLRRLSVLFLHFCAWETEKEPSICCWLCLETGHGGDFTGIQYGPASSQQTGGSPACPLAGLRWCQCPQAAEGT